MKPIRPIPSEQRYQRLSPKGVAILTVKLRRASLAQYGASSDRWWSFTLEINAIAQDKHMPVLQMLVSRENMRRLIERDQDTGDDA